MEDNNHIVNRILTCPTIFFFQSLPTFGTRGVSSLYTRYNLRVQLVGSIVCMVVKIAIWIVRSHDFTISPHKTLRIALES